MLKQCRIDVVLWYAMLVGIAGILTGCGGGVNNEYGTYQGTSVNSLSAFAKMLEADGHQVTLHPGLTPSIDKLDALLVIQHGYELISSNSQKVISDWLDKDRNRVCIIVLRDSDAAIDYWDQIIADESDPDKKKLMQNDRTEIATLLDGMARLQQRGVNDWFGWDNSSGNRLVTSLRDPKGLLAPYKVKRDGLRIIFHRKLVLEYDANKLLYHNDDVLLASPSDYPKRLYFLANCSPICNLGMVEPENRKLALALIKLFPRNSKLGVALSSYNATDDQGSAPSLLRFVNIWPNQIIFAQMVAFLLIFCWHRFPIFGRPKELPNRDVFRFGRHAEALGSLLERSASREFIEAKLDRVHRLYPKLSTDLATQLRAHDLDDMAVPAVVTERIGTESPTSEEVLEDLEDTDDVHDNEPRTRKPAKPSEDE